MFCLNIRLRLFEPVEILLLENEPVWRLSDQVVLAVEDFGFFFTTKLIKISENFKSSPEVSLFDLMHAILIILVRELVNDSLPLLKELCSV